MANLKSEIDKLDVDKLMPLPTDLSKLSDVVKNDVKKTDYNKLVTKVDIILILVVLLKRLITIQKSLK